jgi:hypothetical protein
MKKAKIFLIGKHVDELISMVETNYDSEMTLQALLASYPDLLPGDQINPEDPRQWLLVKRELGIPMGQDETDVLSLDHLFLDQDGIPTFVECKRATDTRTRREVVAQMLDYASNGTEYWPMDRLRQAAAETARAQNKLLDEELSRFLGENSESDIEAYWQLVERNLRDGRVRLIFVSDEIPRELRRLVEFLNTKMADVEVLAVEIKQFLSKYDHKAMVPRVIGLTEAARAMKPRNPIKQFANRDEFLTRCDPASIGFFSAVLDSAEERGHNIYWGTQSFSVRVHSATAGSWQSFLYCKLNGDFEFYWYDIEQAAELRKHLLDGGDFKVAGKNTIRAKVTKEKTDHLKEVYNFISEKIAEIAERKVG